MLTVMHLSDYNLIEHIGGGGMGEVWYAENLHTQVPYAVKLLPVAATRDGTFVARFFDEGRIMAQLDHSNIVRVHHVGHDKESDRYYLVMDLVLGEKTEDGGQKTEVVAPTLHDLLSEAPDSRLPEKDVQRWAEQVAEALAYAHEHGVIHRDIKPANILIDQNGNARVTDFGLAKAVGEEYLQSQIHVSIEQSMGFERTTPQAPQAGGRAEVGGQRTEDGENIEQSMGEQKTFATPLRSASYEGQAGDTPGSHRSSADSLLGTYDYMSPEQRGELTGVDVSAASDVYAFGVMLYRMLTGRRPAGKAKDPSRLVKGLSKRWDTITDKCLEHQPKDRYANGQALRAALMGRVVPSMATVLKRVALIVCVGAIGYAGWQYSYKPRQASQRERQRQSLFEQEANQRIAMLLDEARRLYDSKQYADAGERVAAVFELDAGNAAAKELKKKIRLAVGMDEAVPEKTKAEMALGRAKSFSNTWFGRDKLVQDAEFALKNGLAFYDKEEYGAAVEQFRAVQLKASELDARAAAWSRSESFKGDAEKSMNAARACGADHHAMALWKKALDAKESADELCKQGGYAAAGNAYRTAKQIFDAAEAYANGVQSVAKAVSDYDDVRNAVDLDLERYGGEKWLAVKGAISSAEMLAKSTRWGEAAAKYNEARQGLAGAVAEAEAEQQELVRAEKEKARLAADAKRKQADEVLRNKQHGQKDADGSIVAGYSNSHPKYDGYSKLMEMRMVKLPNRHVWMSEREVSNRQFRLFRSGHDSGSISGLSLNNDKHPVVYVTYREAVEFCEWLTRKEGKSGTYRLPTVDEWDAAFVPESTYPPAQARMNIADKSMTRSSAMSGFAGDPNYDDGYAATAPCGSFSTNIFGFYDLSGNVREWTASADDNGYHMVRGSSWRSLSKASLSKGYGQRFSPERARNDEIGFRIVYDSDGNNR